MYLRQAAQTSRRYSFSGSLARQKNWSGSRVPQKGQSRNTVFFSSLANPAASGGEGARSATQGSPGPLRLTLRKAALILSRNYDGLVQSRHSGENRSPGNLQQAKKMDSGFRRNDKIGSAEDRRPIGEDPAGPLKPSA
jgi:hypothetical protein